MYSQIRFPKRSVLLLCFVLAFIHLLIVIVNHYCFRTFAYDYAVYNFAFYDFAHLRVSPCPVYLIPFVTFMQDHFSVTLIVLSPLYWIIGWLTGTYTLLIVQWLFIVFGAWATYKLIELKSGDYRLATLSLLYYFTLFGRFSASDADCNLAIIGSAVVPAFLYFFESKKIPAAIACFLFMMINREDYSLWMFFICITLMIVHRKDQVKLKAAALFFSAAIVLFVLVFKVFIPALGDEHQHYNFFKFAVLGQTPGEAFRFIFSHPLRALELLFVNPLPDPAYDGVKKEFYVLYLLSGGFVLLLRPVYLIPFLPLLAKKMYTDEPNRWSIISYYSVEFVAILPAFIFLILSELKLSKIKLALAVLVCAFTICATYEKIETYWRIANFGDSSKHSFFKPSFYKPLYDLHKVNDALQLIPDHAAVSASCRVTPHLAYREKIYLFPRIDDAEYIMLLRHDDAYPLSQGDFEKKIREVAADPQWKVIRSTTDLILFSRR